MNEWKNVRVRQQLDESKHFCADSSNDDIGDFSSWRRNYRKFCSPSDRVIKKVSIFFPIDIFLIEFSPYAVSITLTLFRLSSRHNSISSCYCESSTPRTTSLKYGEQCTSIGLLNRLHNIYRAGECPVHQQFEWLALKNEKNYCFRFVKCFDTFPFASIPFFYGNGPY